MNELAITRTAVAAAAADIDMLAAATLTADVSLAPQGQHTTSPCLISTRCQISGASVTDNDSKMVSCSAASATATTAAVVAVAACSLQASSTAGSNL